MEKGDEELQEGEPVTPTHAFPLPPPPPQTPRQFYNSDLAFASARLTFSPMFIKQLTTAPSWADQIVGASDILAEAGVKGTVNDLAAAGKLFVVDFSTFAPMMAPSWNSNLEAPIGLFFLAPDEVRRKEG